MQGTEQTSGIEEEWSVRKRQIALFNGAQVITCDSGLADSPGRQVQDPVSIILDFGEKLRYATLGPVLADDRQYVTQHVRLGDGTVNVRNDHLVIVTPQVNVTFATSRSLIGCCYAEHGLVSSISQVQFALESRKNHLMTYSKVFGSSHDKN